MFTDSHPTSKEMDKKIWCGKTLPFYSDSVSSSNSIYSVE